MLLLLTSAKNNSELFAFVLSTVSASVTLYPMISSPSLSRFGDDISVVLGIVSIPFSLVRSLSCSAKRAMMIGEFDVRRALVDPYNFRFGELIRSSNKTPNFLFALFLTVFSGYGLDRIDVDGNRNDVARAKSVATTKRNGRKDDFTSVSCLDSRRVFLVLLIFCSCRWHRISREEFIADVPKSSCK